MTSSKGRPQYFVTKSIFVETDTYRNTAFRLYESVGFRVVREVLVYRKDYNDTSGRRNTFLSLLAK
jgi:ribosomal protein S18 acetylase RimI-like enzyme